MMFRAGVLVCAAALLVAPKVSRAAELEDDSGFSNTSWLPKDGLPSPTIAAITQSEDGYLWLGSSAGLVRFDGVRFVTWEALGGSPLPESLVRALCSSRDGWLWIGFGNLGGVSRVRNGAVENYSSRDGLPQGPIRTLLEDWEGTLWAGGFNGLARFRKGRWEQVGQRHGLAHAITVDRLFEDRRGTLFVATTAGILRLNRDRDVLEPTESGSYRALDVIEDADGGLWLTGQHVPFAPMNSDRLPHLAPSDREMFYGYRLHRDAAGSLWVATMGQGLLYLRESTWSSRSRVKRLTRQQGLTSDWVTALFEDHEGNMWVGTQAGLNRLSPHRTNPISSRTEFAGQTVRAVTVTPDGSVWTGTGDGLHRLRNGKSEWFRERDGLPSATIRVLHVDASGTLWVATSRGPARFAGGRFSPVALPAGLRLDRIEAMTSDRQSLWFCDFGGMYRLSDGTVAKVDVGSSPGKWTPPSAAHFDREGRIWIGFSGGGLAVHHNDAWRHYTTQDGLSDGGVRVIHEDRAGVIWVGTLNGLSKFVNERFISITHDDGLPGNRLTALVEGIDHGELWLGTDAGLVRTKTDRFDEAAKDLSRHSHYRLLDASDGLEGVPTAQGQPTSARSPDGMLWFVTSEGMAVVDPRAVREYPPPFPPVMERVLADDRPFLPDARLRLPARTESVQIDYTSLTFTAASRILFRYRLEGYDTHWVDAGTRRQAYYTNLPPRSYQFRVAASRGEGAWVESATTWPISIAPAFYQTSWFYATCATMPALGLWMAWRLRLRQIRRKFTVVLAERERLAREIHDTLLQGMLGVALQLHGVSETLDPSQGDTKERCARARDCLEHYIRETRQSIWDLRSPTLEVHDLATALRETAASITAISAVNVSVQVSGRPRSCGLEKERHLLRIGQEAISNAVRHANASEVRVQLSYDWRELVLRVADDGQGFDPEAVSHAPVGHWGLKSMRERAGQVGGRLTVTSTPGNGTVVELVMSTPKQRGTDPVPA